MERLSAAEAERILATALDRPAGIDLVFGALAEIPGVEFDPGRERGLLHAAIPTSLRAGEWTFYPVKNNPASSALESGHTVGGVILSRSTLSAPEAAARLAPAVFEAARRHGGEALEQAESVIGALGEVLGL